MGVVPFDFTLKVWRTMYLTPRHTFLVLTKRPERARVFLCEWLPSAWQLAFFESYPGILPNVHLGVTVENQRRADERIPILLQTPAAVRFVVKEAGWLFRPPRERRTPTAADKN
jgi:protein gp37